MFFSNSLRRDVEKFLFFRSTFFFPRKHLLFTVLFSPEWSFVIVVVMITSLLQRLLSTWLYSFLLNRKKERKEKKLSPCLKVEKHNKVIKLPNGVRGGGKERQKRENGGVAKET